jgi:hypothetical protein
MAHPLPALALASLNGGAGPAWARLECQVMEVAAAGAVQPDRLGAARAAFRAWEGEAARLGRPYRWLLARELPGQPEIAANGAGFLATARAYPCIATTAPLPCGPFPTLRSATDAGCPVFVPLGR